MDGMDATKVLTVSSRFFYYLDGQLP